MSDIIKSILSGDRVALSRAITLVESQKADHRSQAISILRGISNQKTSRRIVISGPPGVGKSSFIEAFGLHLISQKRKVAVVAIDPSSSISGGSILGDRTRMEELSKSDEAFIRPSPSGTHLGGVASRTREVILLCEAAGYDDILIETVGVGQSEYEARYLSDMMIFLAQPASGDDLQGIKRGIMEMTDLIVVNKADGNTKDLAEQTKVHLQAAINLGLKNKKLKVIKASAIQKTGLDEASQIIDEYFSSNSKQIREYRNEQKAFWLRELYIDQVQSFWREDQNSAYWKSVEAKLKGGKTDVWQASSELFRYIVKK